MAHRMKRKTFTARSLPLPALACRGLFCILLSVGVSGCISRVLQIRTEPSGAQVFVEGEEIGTTPTAFKFDHYGTRDVLLVLPTIEDESIYYKPIREQVDLQPRWWSAFPIDFFVEILPFTVTDTHTVVYTFEKTDQQEMSLEELKNNMNEMQNKLLEE